MFVSRSILFVTQVRLEIKNQGICQNCFIERDCNFKRFKMEVMVLLAEVH